MNLYIKKINMTDNNSNINDESENIRLNNILWGERLRKITIRKNELIKKLNDENEKSKSELKNLKEQNDILLEYNKNLQKKVEDLLTWKNNNYKY